MATFKRFEDMESWQLAREICKDVSVIVKKGDLAKDFELKKQMRKSSGSIMDNIAEGFERGGKQEFIFFLGISKGSAGELRSQLYRSLDETYISQSEFDLIFHKCEKEGKMLGGLIDYLNSSDIKGRRFFKNPQP